MTMIEGWRQAEPLPEVVVLNIEKVKQIKIKEEYLIFACAFHIKANPSTFLCLKLCNYLYFK